MSDQNKPIPKTNMDFGLEKVRALVVDDSSSDRLLIKTILNRLGISQIQEADNGISGSFHIQNSIATKNFFDLVITDWSMPGKSGLDLLTEIRSAKELSSTPVILVTSVKAGAKPGWSDKIGAQALITKPLNFGELVDKIQLALAGFKAK